MYYSSVNCIPHVVAIVPVCMYVCIKVTANLLLLLLLVKFMIICFFESTFSCDRRLYTYDRSIAELDGVTAK